MGVPEVPASLRSWMSAVSEIVRSVNAAEPLASVLTRVAGALGTSTTERGMAQ